MERMRSMQMRQSKGYSVSVSPGIRLMFRPDGLGNAQFFSRREVGPPHNPNEVSVALLNDGNVADPYLKQPKETTPDQVPADDQFGHQQMMTRVEWCARASSGPAACAEHRSVTCSEHCSLRRHGSASAGAGVCVAGALLSEPWRPPHRRHRRCIASASAIQRGPGPLVCLRPRAWGGQDWCRRTVGALLPGPASARHVSAFCDGLHSPAPSSVHRRCIGAPARPRAPRLPPSPSSSCSSASLRSCPLQRRWVQSAALGEPRHVSDSPRRAAGRRAPRESF
ncbi:unnamed protein product [Prorocentrum cordatum]|uniref:Uncharacterized protein n=1 Tax=Prorocentrum cordatum TaxID=2364126 RepID=A0ABN9V6G3_9DINO|nr:unnamed protein product [Polarella glacialis]